MKILLQGKWVITRTGARHEIIKNGAVCVEGAKITDVGSYEDLRRSHDHDVNLGSENHIIMPGLINAHNHGKGLSSLQTGIRDEPLETRFHSRLYWRGSGVNTYDNSLLHAIRLIRSGVTCTMHFYYGPKDPGNLQEYQRDCESAIEAWKNAGMRVAFAPVVQNQHKYVYEDEEKFISNLPNNLKKFVKAEDVELKRRNYFRTFNQLIKKSNNTENMTKVLLGPAGSQWCTEDLLEEIKETARRLDTGIHMHFLETKYQKKYASRAFGKTVTQHLDDLGFMGPEVSCGHCVWLVEKDMEILARTGAIAVHNPSANLRLHSGISPVLNMKKHGVRVALGTDNNGLNDDEDMFQEMRLCQLLHRVDRPDIDGRGLSSSEVLGMATAEGAMALRFGDEIGSLEIGKKADIVLVNMKGAFNSPFMSSQIPVLDTIIQRVKGLDVDHVIINGRIVMKNRRLTSVNEDQLLENIMSTLRKSPSQRSESRIDRELDRLKEQIRCFFRKWD